MKSLLNKLFAIVFIAMLTVSCTSSITAPEQQVEKEPKVEQQDNVHPNDLIGGESGVRPIKGRPDF